MSPRERAHPVAIRWTIGDVSTFGFEALRLSAWGAFRLFGEDARYTVCVNSVPVSLARMRAGELPPNVALRAVLTEHPVTLSSELDEQGLQVAALTRLGAPRVVRLEEVSICSPFPPHIPHVGSCGVHCVGLNANRLSWSYNGRPAVDHLRDHWRSLRQTIYERIDLPMEAES